jgi:hypothetical protein
VNTRRRLDLLYPGQYTLRVEEHTAENEFAVHLSLHVGASASQPSTNSILQPVGKL